MKTFLLLLILCFWGGSSFAESNTGSPCRELLLNRCQECHYLQRVCSKVGERSKRRWKATLKRMVKRRGAKLDRKEQMVLLECLATPDPTVLKECGKTNSSHP
jgi:hypothetical protein